jgi:putative sigma-54 modulation protein
MDIIVRGKHIEVPEAVEARAKQKLGRLGHYLPALEDATIEVHLAYEKAKEPGRRYIAHVAAGAHGVHLQAEERAASLEHAIDQVAHVLTRQARRQKQKLYERGRARGVKDGAPNESTLAPEQDDGNSELDLIASVEYVAIKPMTTEEAVEQMELSGQSFFLFHDADAGQFALLVRRENGGFGLIVPELS